MRAIRIPRARYYDPKAGRFLSRDPIGFAGGDVNVYTYVRNSPVNYVDALGLYYITYRPSPILEDLYDKCGDWPYPSNCIDQYDKCLKGCNNPCEDYSSCLLNCISQRGFCYAKNWIGKQGCDRIRKPWIGPRPDISW